MDVIGRLYNRAPRDADTVVATRERGRGRNDAQSSGPNVGAIVGGVVGGLGGLALLGILFWWWRRRRTLSRARAKPKELFDPEIHSDLPNAGQPVHVPPEATQIHPFLGAAVAPIPETLHSSTERGDTSPPHYLHVTNASPIDGEGGYPSEKKRGSTTRSTASHLSPTTSSYITSGSSEGDHSEVARLQRQVEHLTQENNRLNTQFNPPAYEHPK